MTDFEKEKDTVKLTAEELEQVAGGAGVKRQLRVTQDCNVHDGPGKNYPFLHVVHRGDMFKRTYGEAVDERGVKWFLVLSGRGTLGYISSRCVEFV